MPLSLVRVDDRLIHGQVIAVWVRALNPSIIVIADAGTAADEFLAEVLELAAPPCADGEALTVADAVPRIIQLAESPTRAYVQVRSPVSALELRKQGAPIDVRNVGRIGSAPGRKPL